MPFYDFAHNPHLTSCPTRVYDLLREYRERDAPVLCPDCLLPMARVWTVSSRHRAAEDNIPGGLWLENYGPEPIQVYSHTERKRLLKVLPDGTRRKDKKTGQEYELQEMVRHTPVPGTGRSPHTVDWSAGSIDAQTLENARILVSRPGAKGGDESRDRDDVPNDPGAAQSSPLLRLFSEVHRHREAMKKRASAIKAICPICGNESWCNKPSGSIVCSNCGAPYVPPSPATLRP